MADQTPTPAEQPAPAPADAPAPAEAPAAEQPAPEATPGVVGQDTGYQLADGLSPEEASKRAAASAEGGGPWPEALAEQRATQTQQAPDVAALYEQQAEEAKS